MTVEVLVPWRDVDCPHRAAALDWVLRRYTTRYPEWKVTVAAGPVDGPWVKASAVNPAVAASTADVVVVADSDVWADNVAEAVDHVRLGPRRWAVPHGQVHRFTPEFTARVLDGADPAEHTSVSLIEPARHQQHVGGGLVVVRRDLAADVPFDPRFEGWGGEDVSWGWALATLGGKPWRGAAALFHLWHPPQDRPARSTLPPSNDALGRRYHAAKGHPERMRNLLAETFR